MAMKKIASGTVICSRGQMISTAGIITSGTVRATYLNDEFLLEKGDAISLLDLGYGYSSFTYTAETDVTLFEYNTKTAEDLYSIIKTSPDISGLMSISVTKTMCSILDNYMLLQYNANNFYTYLINSYSDYKSLCQKYMYSAKSLPGIEALEPLKLEDDLPTWFTGYYESILSMEPDLQRKLFVSNPDFFIGYLIKAIEDVHRVFELVHALEEYQAEISYLLLNENHLDFFDLYTSIYFRTEKDSDDALSLSATISKMMIQMEGQSTIDKQLYKNRINEYKSKLQNAELPQQQQTSSDTNIVHASGLTDSLDVILEYSGCSGDLIAAFKKNISTYKKIMDKTSSEDTVRLLRKELTAQFYEVYYSAFQISLMDKQVPTLLKMFFLFGYMDEELAGMEHANYLYSVAESYKGDAAKGVYTIYEWLVEIYKGRKDPSRNEFDIDFTSHIRELRFSGKITEELEKKLAADPAQRVMFELQNMFPQVNKMTYGRITTFCPIFSEHNLLKNPETILVNPAGLMQTINEIREIDYSAFYRETLYSNPACGIPKESIHVEVLPDIILMPNVGIRGVMWQEIEGKKRTTPARMMLPVMCMEDSSNILIRLTGEYRWEMCKRVQGARWNDVSDRSLTSEYFDYIQFYRKNNDLSPDAKEKIKAGLQKAKNSYREMFVRDYVIWITYENKGALRLNKVTRKILFQYCPFSKEICMVLNNNPQFKEILDRTKILTAQKLHRLENVFLKLQNAKFPVPAELLAERDFIQR